LHCGEIPDGLLVCHHCDNPSCVNPEHLFLGSQADNIADMRSKGRGGHMTKLSQADVLAIRATTGVTQRLLAEEYGVTQQQISNIKRFGAVLLSQTPAAGA
jgi:predicted NUDIX family phosphoesterase